MSRYGKTNGIRQDLTVDTNAYSAGDNVAGLKTIDALGSAFGSGVLKHVTITDNADQKAAMTIVFFDSLPASTFTNNVAFPALTDADLGRVIGKVEVLAADYTTLNGKAVATVECSIALWSMQSTAGPDGPDKRTAYYAIQTSGTPTYTGTGSVKVKFGFLGD